MAGALTLAALGAVFDPVERFAAFVPGVDVGADRGLEGGDGGVCAAADGHLDRDLRVFDASKHVVVLPQPSLPGVPGRNEDRA